MAAQVTGDEFRGLNGDEDRHDHDAQLEYVRVVADLTYVVPSGCDKDRVHDRRQADEGESDQWHDLGLDTTAQAEGAAEAVPAQRAGNLKPAQRGRPRSGGSRGRE